MTRAIAKFLEIKERRKEAKKRGGSGKGENGKGRGERSHVRHCSCLKCRRRKVKELNEPCRLYYKSSTLLVEAVCQSRCFLRTNKSNWNVCWTLGAKSELYRSLKPYQKINSFPRTHEITRKDQLCRNIMRMQETYGRKKFDFIPQSFVLPAERDAFERLIRRSSSSKPVPDMWIVKPAAAACGRGIYVTDNVAEIPLGGMDESNCLVSAYIKNPLLFDNRKFDLRVYVGVTSFSPLKIYMYEEGLVRRATAPYTNSPANLHNRFVHLTNYSVQKRSENFVKSNSNQDPEASNKWSFETLRTKLEEQGVDSEVLFERIGDIVVKTMISIEPQVLAAMEMFVKYPENCFQLFGFDIIVEAKTEKPWLIEVNLGPSLTCDSELDLDIKSKMLSDLFSLAGVMPFDPKWDSSGPTTTATSTMSKKRALKELELEEQRAGGWKRLYPTPDSSMFQSFFPEKRPLNEFLVKHLSTETSLSNHRRFVEKLQI